MKKSMPAWFVLGLIALLAGCLLGFTNELTAPTIAEQTRAAAVEARKNVLPNAETFEELTVADGAVDNCFVGKSGGEAVGHAVQVTVSGYGGPIEVVVGIGSDGIISGISVGGANFSETVGLGAKTKEPAFTDQFKGMEPPLVLKSNVDSVTGASISSGAVVDAVNTAVDYVSSLS